MPTAPMHPCPGDPRCPVLLPWGVSRCPDHAVRQESVHGWGGNSTRVRGRKLQAMRTRLFRYEPLCRLCKADGRTRVATIRDHIVPLAEGGTDEDDNIQPLCQTCSDTKTHAESARGTRRGAR